MTEQKTKLLVILTSILVFLTILFGVIIYIQQETLQSVISSSQSQTSPSLVLTLPEVEPVVLYRMNQYPETEDLYLFDTYNIEIVIQSLNTLCGEKVKIFINDNIEQLFYVRDWVEEDSILPPQRIYRINPEATSCEVLEVSEYFGEFGQYIISPDNKKMALAIETEPKIIRVVFFEEDKQEIVARAEANQTFNAGWGGVTNNFVFLWDDEKTLQYDTFAEVADTPFYRQNGKPLILTQLVEVE